MKFVYTDESGSEDQSDVFVICGLMVDAYKLRKKTAEFDQMLRNFLARHPRAPEEIKTSRFINGKGGWNSINPDERKNFLKDVCSLAVDNGGKLFGIALSMSALRSDSSQQFNPPFKENYWLAGGMYICCLIQKKMQKIPSNKGLTVLIIDDNKTGMSQLSDALYHPDPWYDGLYQLQANKSARNRWPPIKESARFDQIINSAYAIKSQHSSLIQVMDAICYIYRRHLEIDSNGEESWLGEKDYYQCVYGILEPHRELLGKCPTDSSCVKFYNTIKHPLWKL